MNLGGQVDPLLPYPPDDADDYTKELNRRLRELFAEYAKRVDSVIPYSVDTTKVLVPDPDAQGGINWGAGGGSGGLLTTMDEGTTLSTVVTTLDFVGAGVTAVATTTAKTTVTIPGLGGGSTLLDFVWGSQQDGAFTFDGVTTPAFASRAGSVYTLSRNCHFTTCTVDNGITVKMGGFAMFGLSLENNGDINDVNNAGGTPTGGGVLHSDQYTGVAGAGPNGGTSTTGGNCGVLAGLCAQGGIGGTGGTKAGGTVSNQTLVPTISGNLNELYLLGLPSLRGVYITNSGTIGVSLCRGGGGGSGGGGEVGGGQGGGGGAGGGVVLLRFKEISGNGTINAYGRNGGNAGGGVAAGGGGGGGGGLIMIWTTTANYASLNTVSVAKGLGGNGINGGANGGDGDNGLHLSYLLAA